MRDKTALTYWFPLIKEAGLPVPKTIILQMPEDAQAEMWEMFDGKATGKALEAFAKEVTAAAAPLGFPLFLRTAHTSGKHNWKHTCFVQKPENVLARIYGVAEFSECCGMFGELPWDTWVLREMLPTMPFGVCPRYGDMPICKEFRFFVENGAIKCFHPYWPLESLEQGGAENIDYKSLCALPDNELDKLAIQVSNAVKGAWSVDVLETKRGWFVTDMAEAANSYHWPACPINSNQPTDVI